MVFPTASVILSEAAHRPWSLPQRPWVMAQSWQQLLFAHWRVPVEALRPHIPATLELDTFDGEAWLGIVPFSMREVHPRAGFNVKGLSDFPELNVRTYVQRDGKPGVWFFSLEAGNRFAVRFARRFFHLPYFKASMSSTRDGDWMRYRSERAGTPPVRFEAKYRPISPVFRAESGSLDHWLTERYCLYCTAPSGSLFRCEIQHKPWSLQRAEAEITVNSMVEGLGITLPDEPPLLHYSERLDVLNWYLERLSAVVPTAPLSQPA